MPQLGGVGRRVLALVACFIGAGLVTTAVADSATSQPSLPATFTVTGVARTIPSSFFGLSIEYRELPAFEAEGRLFDRVISLVRPQSGRRMVLRLGGKSADHYYWEQTPLDKSARGFVLDREWVGALASLVRRDHLRAMLDLNLAVHSPTLAASFARAV